ncbi:MAG TPA: S1/P1 nuclease [Steroidobacteraceae bacterium]|nr:S1/P1 nuclease [Steroidobacteraceae bacterium]
MIRHHRDVIVLTAVLLGGLGGPTAEAWGPEAHQTIGAIADSLLVGSHAEKEVTKILGSEKLQTAALWADCVKGVSDTPPYKYHLNSRYRECDPFQQTEPGRQEMEDYVRRNSTPCHPERTGEACHRQYHYTDVAIEHVAYDRADVGTSDHDVVSVIEAAIAKLNGQPVPAPISFETKKEALRVLAHLVGDVHQPLHVGAIYLDAAGHEVDPDAGAYDPATRTRGGNLLVHGRSRKLHGEWDAIPRRLTVSQFLNGGVTLVKRVPVTTGPISGWPRAWASETVGVSRAAFSGLHFGIERNSGTGRAEWPVIEPANYATQRAALQKEQLVRAGARLAQVLEAVFP